MGKFKIFSILLVALFALIACGDSKDSTKESKGGTVEAGLTENENEKEKEKKKELTHNYPYFDLKMTYANGKYINVYFDYNDDISKTKYESTSKMDKTNVDLTGEEAYEILQPILEQFTFTDSVYPTIASQVRKGFDIFNGWKTFELKAELADGTEIELIR